MPEKVLSADQIQRLLKSQPKPIAERWPNDEDLMLIAKAVRDKKEFVILSNEKKFSIRYKSHWDSVFLKPANGEFVPCGYLPLDQLRGILKHGIITR